MIGVKKSNLRLAIVSDPKVPDSGLGSAKDLTWYGDYNSVCDEHEVLSRTMNWLITNGLSRWSISNTGRVSPIGADDYEKLSEDDKNNKVTHQITLTVVDPGI